MDCELHYHSFPMMIRRGHRLGQASGTTGAINCCPQLDGIGQCSRTGTPHQQSARLIVKLVGVEREVVDLVGRPVWCCNIILNTLLKRPQKKSRCLGQMRTVIVTLCRDRLLCIPR